MKSLFKFFIVSVGLTVLMSFAKEDCSVLKDSQFSYKHGSDDVIVLFRGNKHIELHNNRKYFIKSDIEWISDCEYYLTIRETTLPRFPFDMGTRLHIEINKIKNDKVYYTSSLKGRSWEGRLTKIERYQK